MNIENCRTLARLHISEQKVFTRLELKVRLAVHWAESSGVDENLVAGVTWLADAFVGQQLNQALLQLRKIPHEVTEKLQDLQALSGKPGFFVKVRKDPVLRATVIGSMRAMMGSPGLPAHDIQPLAQGLFVLTANTDEPRPNKT